MATPEHLAKLKEGTEAWNEWRWEQEEYLDSEFVPSLAEVNFDELKKRVSGEK